VVSVTAVVVVSVTVVVGAAVVVAEKQNPFFLDFLLFSDFLLLSDFELLFDFLLSPDFLRRPRNSVVPVVGTGFVVVGAGVVVVVVDLDHLQSPSFLHWPLFLTSEHTASVVVGAGSAGVG
jgi:hypothetical protein